MLEIQPSCEHCDKSLCNEYIKWRFLLLLFLAFHLTSCIGQVNKTSVAESKEDQENTATLTSSQMTVFPQIHTNLNGMVKEFVRTMHQDTKGNFWFGTNGNGIIRYNGHTLEAITIEGVHPHERILSIAEDKTGNIWFGTSTGLIKHDGKKFKLFSFKEGLPGTDPEIWALTLDKSGLLWVGCMAGLSHFDGEKFTPFSLPTTMVENPQHMLSDKLVFKIIQDKSGTIWMATDGNGIFKYDNGKFTHLTTKNGLADNNTSSLLEDHHGNIWIGSFYGGISKFDGTTFTHYTKEGIIEGLEAGGLYEDSKGNIWFTAEGIGVYKYNGKNFVLYTTKDGLTSNTVQSILKTKKANFGLAHGKAYAFLMEKNLSMPS